MSAPLKLTTDELRDLANALDGYSKIRRQHAVCVGGYGRAEVTVGDVVLAIKWDDDAELYALDDRIGD